MNTVRNFFSEVFKRHTEDDAEQVVIVGAIGTIPDPDTLTSECPRPWLYTRVFMFFMLVTALLFFWCSGLFRDTSPELLLIHGGRQKVPAFALSVPEGEFAVAANLSDYRTAAAAADFCSSPSSRLVTDSNGMDSAGWTSRVRDRR